MALFRDPLDALLDSAMAQASNRKAKALPDKKTRLEILKESFNTTYTNPDNWTQSKSVALIHKASNGHLTLLGAFKEFLHKRTSARKLCRCTEPLAIDCEEIVTGDWWLRNREEIHWAENPEHLTTREFAFDLELGELQVFAKTVQIRVYLKENWISKVELIEQTQFACPTNKIFLYFPAGLDILEGMSFENKMSLRKVIKGEIN
jgi:hypothetical protein